MNDPLHIPYQEQCEDNGGCGRIDIGSKGRRACGLENFICNSCKLTVAIKCIEFYADGMNWKAHPIDASWNNIIRDDDCEHCIGGTRATKCLKEIKDGL